MRVYDASHIRNIALFGHAGSGKTTLAECMLFESGEIPRRGSVDNGSSTSDFHDIEYERRSSVFGTVMFAEWRDYKINIIDTPGYPDYVGEVLGALRICDTGIMVLNASIGVEVGSDRVWKYAEQFQKPMMFIVNKIDHERSNFDRCVKQAKERFGREATIVQYPVSEGPECHTIIDVLTMLAYVFPEGGGKPEKIVIPADELEKAKQLHNELIEIIAENDENLMDHYLSQGELSEEEMRQGLTTSLIKRHIFPIFCMSAKNNMGSGRIMSFIDFMIPAPVELPGVPTESGEMLNADPDGTTCIFVFKATSEPNVGDMSFFRVYSGTVKHGMDLFNEQTGITERLGQLFVVNGQKRHEVSQLQAGDIGAVVKLKNTHVNNTLHEKGYSPVLPSIIFPKPIIRTAISLVKKGEEDKLGIALHHLHEEDPTLIIEHSAELKQIILHGQGEMHLSAAKHRLQNRFKIDVEFNKAKVPYRETIRSEVKEVYRHKRQSGGAGQFAEVHMLLEPFTEGMADPAGLNVRHTEEHELPWGGKLVFLNCIVGGTIDQRFLPAILKGVMERMHEGPITGSFVRDIRVTIYDGKMHPVDSSDLAFKTAARMAFKHAFRKANPQLLEPIHHVEIMIPEEFVGDILSDLPVHRGEILGIDADGHYQIIRSRMPLSQLDHYAMALRSITQGRASFTSELAEYNPIPMQMQSQIHEEYLKHAVEEE